MAFLLFSYVITYFAVFQLLIILCTSIGVKKVYYFSSVFSIRLFFFHNFVANKKVVNL